MTNPKRLSHRKNKQTEVVHGEGSVLRHETKRDDRNHSFFDTDPLFDMGDECAEYMETIQRTKDFMKRVKELDRSTKHRGKYKFFLRLMKYHSNGCVSLRQISDVLRVLFKHSEDLVRELEWFCLDISEASDELHGPWIHHGSELDQVIKFINRAESLGPSLRENGDAYFAFLDALTRFKGRDRCADDVKILRDELVAIFSDNDVLMKLFDRIVFNSGIELTKNRDGDGNAENCDVPQTLTREIDDSVPESENVKESPEKKTEDEIRREKMLEREDKWVEEDLMINYLKSMIKFAEDFLEGKETPEKPPLGFRFVFSWFYKEGAVEMMRAFNEDKKRVLQGMLQKMKNERQRLKTRRRNRWTVHATKRKRSF